MRRTNTAKTDTFSAAATAARAVTAMAPATLPPRAGVGLKAPHYRMILERRPAIGFFEVHAENYMGAGGPPHRYLTAIREHYPLSLHGVGLSIGAVRPLDRRHLSRLRKLLDRYQPALFSEHLAWSSHGSVFLDDLLPLPYTTETLRRVVSHIDQTQETLGRQLLLENPSTYIGFAESSYAEWDFIAEIVRRCGCALLLDVNNLYISCTNQRWDPERYLAHYPLAHVREIHLAGHQFRRDDRGRPLLIDTHDRPTAGRVWRLYAQVIARVGPIPTLIEWDAHVPAWPVLASEARRADAVLLGANTRYPVAPVGLAPALAATHRGTVRSRRSAANPARGTKEAPPLRQRQQQFARALLDRTQPPPQGLQDPEGQACPRRFDVYRNNVAASLIEALEASFPAVCRLVGSRFFRAMAGAYAANEPPRSPLLWEYGAEFPRFIAGFAPAASLPYLSDVAHIERAWLEAYHAPDSAILDPQELAQIPTERVGEIHFALHPSVRWVSSSYPALTIWRVNAARAAPASIAVAAAAEEALLVRAAAEVQVRALPPGGSTFLQSLARGRSLADATVAATAAVTRSAHAPPFDLADQLARLLDDGAFQGFSLTTRNERGHRTTRRPGGARGNGLDQRTGAAPWP